MKSKGRKLIFILQIKGDGTGVIEVPPDYVKALSKTEFTLTRLSITNDTYIASEFHSFIVKLKT